MCGRAALTKNEKELEQRFNATFYSEDIERYNPLPNYNVAPTHTMPVITNEDPDHFRPLRWGLIPFWAKDHKIGYKMINARVETILEKPAFRNAVKSRRCLVPFDGFYEWKKESGGKTPFYIRRKDQQLFSIAGLWEKWTDPSSGEDVFSFTLITQKPNETMAAIHDRMPALLQPDQEASWIDMGVGQEEAVAMIEPYPDDWLDVFQVTKEVNNVRNNGPELIVPSG
jgi:putative SOS response-associated peptidase YedK